MAKSSPAKLTAANAAVARKAALKAAKKSVSKSQKRLTETVASTEVAYPVSASPYADHIFCAKDLTACLCGVYGFQSDNAEDYRWHLADRTRGSMTFYSLEFNVSGTFKDGLSNGQAWLNGNVYGWCGCIMRTGLMQFASLQVFQDLDGLRVSIVLATSSGEGARVAGSFTSHLFKGCAEKLENIKRLEVRTEGLSTQEGKIRLGRMTESANSPSLWIF